MQAATHTLIESRDSYDSLRLTARIVGLWLLGLLALPPTGLLWQLAWRFVR